MLDDDDEQFEIEAEEEQEVEIEEEEPEVEEEAAPAKEESEEEKERETAEQEKERPRRKRGAAVNRIRSLNARLREREAQIAELYNRFIALEAQVADYEKENGESREQLEERLWNDLRVAKESGDVDSEIKIQRDLRELSKPKARAKPTLEPVPQKPVEPEVERATALARNWVASIGHDTWSARDKQFATMKAAELDREGLRADDPEYWLELTDRIREEAPHLIDSTEATSKKELKATKANDKLSTRGGVAAPVSRWRWDT